MEDLVVVLEWPARGTILSSEGHMVTFSFSYGRDRSVHSGAMGR